MRRMLWPLCVLALFVGLCAWLTHRYFFSAPVRDASGRPVSQVLLSEIGGFADKEFAPTVQSYLRNLEAYERLSMEPLSVAAVAKPDQSDRSAPAFSPDLSRISAALRGAIGARMRDDARGASMVSRQPPQVLNALSDHLALLLARCGGMSSHDYLKGLGPETMMRIDPAQRELIQYVSTTFLRGRALPRESAGQEEIRAFFEELYAAADSFRSGANRVVAWSSDARGFICSMDDMPWEVADADLLSQRMTEQQQMFFYGSLSQAAFVINQPIEGTEQRRRQGSNVLRAHVILIVRTKGGDYYPIAFRWWYDAKLRRWWLTGANRQVSPRMATSPHLAF